jgi:hypothetical protein
MPPLPAILAAAIALQAVPEDRVESLRKKAAALEQIAHPDALAKAKGAALGASWRGQAERLAEASRLAREAHEALDRAEYEAAVERHRRSRTMEREAADLEAAAGNLIREAAETNVALLDRDEVEVRDAAERALAVLGPAAAPVLEKALAEAKLEARLRIREVLDVVRGERGRPRIRLAKAAYAANERITVEVRGLPGHHTDWLTIVPAGTPDANWAQYHYGNGQKEGAFEFQGLPAGEYEVRVYFDWPAGGYEVKARHAFKVAD